MTTVVQEIRANQALHVNTIFLTDGLDTYPQTQVEELCALRDSHDF